jgi:alpha-glucosidase
MDSTYKTNKYGMPLFELVGQTSTEETFNIGFAFMSNEKEENFTWVLQQCVCLLRNKLRPNVVVTDRDAALMSAVATVFPDSAHMVCTFHVKKNMSEKCKTLCKIKDGENVKQRDVWTDVSKAFDDILYSTTEDAYVEAVLQFRKLCGRWPRFLIYVETTILDTDKERCVSAWTDKFLHLGNTTTNRVEGAHGVLKGYLKDGHGDLATGWEAIDKMLINRFNEIQGIFGRNLSVVEHTFKDHYLYTLLIFKISRPALNHIHREEKRVEECGTDSKKCGCVMRFTYGLPCACLIAKKMLHKLLIRLDEVNAHWKKLCFLEDEGGSSDDDDYSCLAEWEAVQVHLINLINDDIFLRYYIIK